jgi:menaquinone-dependent protoporphyrinogen IX oxidase
MVVSARGHRANEDESVVKAACLLQMKAHRCVQRFQKAKEQLQAVIRVKLMKESINHPTYQKECCGVQPALQAALAGEACKMVRFPDRFMINFVPSSTSTRTDAP